MAVKCKLCNGVNITKLNLYNTFGRRVCFCRNCRLFFVLGYVPEKTIRKFYAYNYFDKAKRIRLYYYLKNFFSYLRALDQFNFLKEKLPYIFKINNPSVLEIGAAGGQLLWLFKKHGWRIRGLELNKFMRERAKKERNINLESESLFNISNKEKYDLIIFSHVFEHFQDPLKCLKKTKSLLKSKGKIFIEVPNAPIPDKVSFEKLKDFLETTHFFNFTQHSIRRMVKAEGLEIYYQGRLIYHIPKLFTKMKEKIIENLYKGALVNKGVFLATGITFFYLLLNLFRKGYIFKRVGLKTEDNEWQILRIICG